MTQARSKWWWSRPASAAYEETSKAAEGEEVLPGSDGPADLFSSSGSVSGTGGVEAESAASGTLAGTGALAVPQDAAAVAAALAQIPDGEVLQAAAAVVEATGAAEVAALAAAKADVWVGTQAFIDLLEFTHSGWAMPWWQAIFFSNLVVRVATFPVTVLTQKKSGRMTELRVHSQHMQSLHQAASRATSLAEYERLQSQIGVAQDEIRTKYGKDAKWALIMPGMALLNMTVFISQFSAVSTLAKEGLPSMSHEGLAWFADLTLPDPYWGLPVLCAALTLAMVESGAMSAEMGQAQTAKTLKWVMRAFALIFIPAGGFVPSAVGLLWFSNSIMSLVQAGVLRSPAVRRKLGLPDMAAMQAAAAKAAAEASPSALSSKLQELLGKPAPVAANSSSSSGAGTAASGATGAVQGAAAGTSSSGSAVPPPPGTRPSRLVTQKPSGWKRKKV